MICLQLSLTFNSWTDKPHIKDERSIKIFLIRSVSAPIQSEVVSAAKRSVTLHKAALQKTPALLYQQHQRGLPHLVPLGSANGTQY